MAVGSIGSMPGIMGTGKVQVTGSVFVLSIVSFHFIISLLSLKQIGSS